MKKQELMTVPSPKDMKYLFIRFENEKNNEKGEFLIETSKFIEGKASLNAYFLNLCLIILIMGLTLIIPLLLFPTFYSIKTNTISDLGVYLNNPQGAPIFNAGILITGVLQIPFTMKIYQMIEKGDSKLAKITQLFSLIGALGFIIVGIFPSNIRIPHLLGAFMVFFGYFIIANIDWIILIRKRKRNEEIKENTGHLGIFYIIFNLIAIQFGISLYLSIFYPIYSYGIFSSSLWEWIFFLAIMSWSVVYFINYNKTRLFKSKILNPFFILNKKSRSPLVH
ncbi:DUF998 domain-containing protein [Promethearchaeum syntrophicum]|uniref:DUF998 domain-containing protein n=1 Tax=Promethearchaeum syntrophicum TaxID=2594042 RepID=A0A5B9D5V5_9ARCH|nr:DUF998 domain-containing protein [Candidatus Prometheoarchaeum syntrophicum]